MISKTDATEAFVWMWLPGATEPVVAGRLDQDSERLLFTYGASYRRRENSISIYDPELPLKEGVIAPINGLPMASCIRDGSPDAWGRRVIINRLTGRKPDAAGVPEISELTFLLQSGSDRIGALDFQASATEYVPRLAAQASLDELMEAAALVEKGVPLHPQPRRGLRQQDHFLPHGSGRNLSNGAVEVGTFCRRIEVASRRRFEVVAGTGPRDFELTRTGHLRRREQRRGRSPAVMDVIRRLTAGLLPPCGRASGRDFRPAGRRVSMFRPPPAHRLRQRRRPPF